MNTVNPWIGLNSYQEGQILYGRSREIQDLSMSVFYNRQTVVYGKSGIGKSSLLHAGIFPMARLRGCLPISVRFDHASEVSYREQIIQHITESVLAAGGMMEDIRKDAEEPKSLWEFFHRMQPQKDGQIITPLIVIDQFEEIFTLSKNTQAVRDFFEELADLFNNVMPDYLQSDDLLRTAHKTGSIFDGLQIKTSDSLLAQEMSYHMVFVLREDYLSFLERYAAPIPALKQNRYGLLPITYRQAMEIITKPCEGLVSAEVANAIIRHITTEPEINDETPVDSAILSLYLSRLFEKKKDAPTISMQLVKEQGDALIEDFYAEVVFTIDRKTIEYLEDVLINTDGHRENVTIESLYKKAGIDPSAIEKLERAHLLRIFSYGNVQRVEFAHDVLCPIIVRRRSQRHNMKRMRKVQRNGMIAMMALFVLLFSALYIILDREESKASIARQQARLNEMEVSLIEKGAQKMLDNHDTYGAIQLLINSMDDSEQQPSEKSARLEKFLRKSVDSLYSSKDSCVANVHFNAYLPWGMTLSPSHRLVAINDLSERVFVVDGQTGSIVQAFSTRYPIPLLNYSAFSASNSSKWKYFVKNGVIIASSQEDEEKGLLYIRDIHPNDSLCLITIDDVLYDCYIQGDDRGQTRLCIHDFPAFKNWELFIADATYDHTGTKIAVMLRLDSIGIENKCQEQHFDYYLYDAHTGSIIQDDTSKVYARQLIEKVDERRSKASNDYDAVWSRYLYTTPNTKIQYEGRQPKVYQKKDYKPLGALENISLFIPSTEQVIQVRMHLDTLSSLPDYLTDFTRSFDFEGEDSFIDNNATRHEWPLAISPDLKRLVLVNPPNAWRRGIFQICGLYPHNGAIYYDKMLPNEVHSLHFTEDDQYLVVNYGEETQEVIYLPPLEQLVDSCKNMFFDWQMTEEDRYQTYIHMND